VLIFSLVGLDGPAVFVNVAGLLEINVHVPGSDRRIVGFYAELSRLFPSFWFFHNFMARSLPVPDLARRVSRFSSNQRLAKSGNLDSTLLGVL
jgi:hypothetical protein